MIKKQSVEIKAEPQTNRFVAETRKVLELRKNMRSLVEKEAVSHFTLPKQTTRSPSREIFFVRTDGPQNPLAKLDGLLPPTEN